MRCEHDENMMMSCLHHPHVMQTMMTWCSYMRTLMTSSHLISMWHEWNTNAGDVMLMWFAAYVNLVTSGWACTSHVLVHGAHAIIKMGAPKYSNSLMGMPANLNLR